MLVGSVFTSIIAFYLNTYYSGPFLNYSVLEQVKDILPSFSIGLGMGLFVYLLGFIRLNAFIMLPMQILLGLFFVMILCELFVLPEYLEVKRMVIDVFNKVRDNNRHSHNDQS